MTRPDPAQVTSGRIGDLYDLNGNHWKYDYVQFGTHQVISHVYDPDPNYDPNLTNALLTFTYSTPAGGTQTVITDRAGRASTHLYNTINDLNVSQNPFYVINKVTDPLVTGDTTAFQATYTWRTSDMTLTSMTDRNSKTWQFTWDANNYGNLLTQQDPTANPPKKFAYDSFNKLISAADESNHRTTYTYDPTTHDLITETLDPRTDPSDGTYSNPNGLAVVKTYAYYTNGNLNTVRVNSDPATSYQYDTWGNTTSVVNPMGNTFSATFDALNNKLTATEPSPGGQTSFTYDAWNRVTKVTHPDTNHVDYTYDNMSNKTSVRDENGHFTYFDIDSMNRVWRTRQDVQYTPSLVQITTVFHYNTVGDKDYAINPRNYQTNYTYDERRHLIRIDLDCTPKLRHSEEVVFFGKGATDEFEEAAIHQRVQAAGSA